MIKEYKPLALICLLVLASGVALAAGGWTKFRRTAPLIDFSCEVARAAISRGETKQVPPPRIPKSADQIIVALTADASCAAVDAMFREVSARIVGYGGADALPILIVQTSAHGERELKRVVELLIAYRDVKSATARGLVQAKPL